MHRGEGMRGRALRWRWSLQRVSGWPTLDSCARVGWYLSVPIRGSGARRESSAAPALRRANDGRTLRLSKRVRPRGETPCASSAGLERVGGSWGGAKPGWCEVARLLGIGCRNDPFTSSRTRRGRASMAAPALRSPRARGRSTRRLEPGKTERSASRSWTSLKPSGFSSAWPEATLRRRRMHRCRQRVDRCGDQHAHLRCRPKPGAAIPELVASPRAA